MTAGSGEGISFLTAGELGRDSFISTSICYLFSSIWAVRAVSAGSVCQAAVSAVALSAISALLIASSVPVPLSS